MKYFDAHCHVQLSAYDQDREEVLARMTDAEVGGLIVGVDFASSKAAVELVQNRPEFFAAIGLHPNDTDEPFNADGFDLLLQEDANTSVHKIRAIGECGLDYYRPDEPESVKKIQKDIFEQQIELAVKYDKPLMIHSRPSKGTQDAYLDTIDLLTSKKREYGDRLRGDMHFFVGGIDEARKFIELDFTMSYTAVLTFTHDYDEVIRYVPISSLLSETDSPFVAPASQRGKRNEPTSVLEVVAAIARIRGEDEEVVREAILRNAAKSFKI
jgi:TatD DNase family protein